MLWKSTPQGFGKVRPKPKMLWKSAPGAKNVMEKFSPRSTSPGSAPEAVVCGSTSGELFPEVSFGSSF